MLWQLLSKISLLKTPTPADVVNSWAAQDFPHPKTPHAPLPATWGSQTLGPAFHPTIPGPCRPFPSQQLTAGLGTPYHHHLLPSHIYLLKTSRVPDLTLGKKITPLHPSMFLGHAAMSLKWRPFPWQGQAVQGLHSNFLTVCAVLRLSLLPRYGMAYLPYPTWGPDSGDLQKISVW